MLPAVLSHPTISLISLVVRDPTSLASSSKRTRRIPTLEECRLFTAGSDSGELVERCLFTGRILQTMTVPAAPIWSMAVSPTHDTLAVASSSANIYLFRLSPDSPDIEPNSPVPRFEGLPGRTKTLSIAWGPPTRTEVQVENEDGEQEMQWRWKSAYLVTGNSDSSVRKWNVGNGRLISRMLVNKLGKKRGQSAPARGNIVWAVAVLSDHTIISADSLGEVTFWDGRSMAPSQTLKGHLADAMCLAVGPDGRSVFTSGPDQKITEFNRVSAEVSDTQDARTRWVITTSKRVHQHDVRALAIFPPYMPLAIKSAPPSLNPQFTPVIASGGLDMQVVLTPAASQASLARVDVKVPMQRRLISTFAESQPTTLGHMPGGRGREVIATCPQKRLIVVRRYRSLGIWRLNTTEEGRAPYDHLCEVALQLRSSLVSAALSPDGAWLAVADLYETKLFKLKQSIDVDGQPSLAVRRVKSFGESLLSSCDLRSTGASSLTFSPDSSTLAIGLSLSPKVVFVHVEDLEVTSSFDLRIRSVSGRTMAPLPRNGQMNGHVNGHADADSDSDEEMEDVDDDDETEDQRPISAVLLRFSDDGQWLASVDSLSRTSVFNLDLLKLHCVLPTFAQPIAAISFAADRKLILGFPVNNTLQAYDLDDRSLDDKYVTTTRTTMSRQPDNIAGMCYSKAHRKVFVWGSTWVASVVPGASARKSKKRRQDPVEDEEDTHSESDVASQRGGVTLTTKFRNIGGVMTMGDELAVIERPFADIAGPPAFAVRKYGT